MRGGERISTKRTSSPERGQHLMLDALNKHRGKGQQKVTVEHVHVHQGGQAVVGTIERPGGGGHERMKI